MKLVLLGPSGAGKGTQAKNLESHFGIKHISTGDMLRDNMKRQTPIGIEIADLMDKGKLVADEIVIKLVKERIEHEDCKNGFILDGFPRTLYQAKILQDIVGKIDKVICIHVEDELIIKRMSGRYSCPECGAVYHVIFYPPKIMGVCDVCGHFLIQRDDDKEATVVNRLKIYHEMTEPIIDFFSSSGLLLRVDGTGEASEITSSIVKSLESGGIYGYPN